MPLTRNPKVGAKVWYTSGYHGRGPENPLKGGDEPTVAQIGEVTEIKTNGWIRVTWGNGCSNTYRLRDLDLAEPQQSAPSPDDKWVVGRWYRRTGVDYPTTFGTIKHGELYKLVGMALTPNHGYFEDKNGVRMHDGDSAAASFRYFEPTDPPQTDAWVEPPPPTPPPQPQPQLHPAYDPPDDNRALARALSQWQFGHSNAAVHFFLTGERLVADPGADDQEEEGP